MRSYPRSVCGCMPVSSAATLITKTGASGLLASTALMSNVMRALDMRASRLAEQRGPRVLIADGGAQRLDRRLGGLVERLWRLDVDRYEQVAQRSVAARRSASLDAKRTAVVGARWNSEGHRPAFEGRH